MAKVISTRDVVFDEETIFNGKTEDIMDNLMHNTLEEIATWISTVELPATQSHIPETETFYEDDTTQEDTPRTKRPQYHQGRKIMEAERSWRQKDHRGIPNASINSSTCGFSDRMDKPQRDNRPTQTRPRNVRNDAVGSCIHGRR